MARRPRLHLPGIPLHVVQRGNNRNACFFAAIDFLTYREALTQAASAQGIALHACVLMTNHVHLLLSASTGLSVSRFMQSVGRRYVRDVNGRYGRSGTLWEGRFKSSLVDSERYLLTCYRYIELNPVRAGMVDLPRAYRWSSHHRNANGLADPLITPHPLYLRLGSNEHERQRAYRHLFEDDLSNEDVDAIRAHTQQERALGSARFQEQIEQQLSKVVRCRGAGRPRKGVAGSEGNVL